jgi:four helix bundle protein
VAETSSLLNCRTRKGTAGSNPAFTANKIQLHSMFDFEKLEIYAHLRLTAKKVIAFLKEADYVDPYLSEQLRKSSVHMLLSLSEGTGRMVNPEKRQFYIIARSAAFESVTMLQLIHDLGMMDEETYQELYADFETASKMLLGMVRSFSTER